LAKQQHSTGIIDHKNQFGGLKAGIDRDGHGTDAEAGEIAEH
jgi:hypothetical protein